MATKPPGTGHRGPCHHSYSTQQERCPRKKNMLLMTATKTLWYLERNVLEDVQCQLPGCDALYDSQDGNMGGNWWRVHGISLCISYKCMWTYYYFKIDSREKKISKVFIKKLCKFTVGYGRPQYTCNTPGTGWQDSALPRFQFFLNWSTKSVNC